MAVAPSDYDVYLFHQGTLERSYRTMGAHLARHNSEDGVCFAVWAPNAKEVRIVGPFNRWSGDHDRMTRIPQSGIWWLFIPGLQDGDLYKYEIITSSGERLLRGDPYAFRSETRPGTASIIWGPDDYAWSDQSWQQQKQSANSYQSAINIYEVHLGSWKKTASGQFLTYEQLSDELIDYVARLGYTHIELLPLAEHPYDRSWGYQITGFYSVTGRYGSPTDFKSFVDRCHQQGIGVILDWVPAHFVRDEHGLRRFDGTPLFEPADERLADKPLWGTLAFDYSKPEVTGFLISNALYWMDEYHIDGLRVDAVASMLHLNFDKPDDWRITNDDGSSHNKAAIEFMKRLNRSVFQHYPTALMIAEDSSDWPLVTRPVHEGGLGFNYKWNMGWMNDTLEFFQLPPSERGPALHRLLFSFLYMYSENYILPLSHDEVVHGKRSLMNKMPGDMESKFANFRLLLMWMFIHPGKKLLFMGGEFAQFDEWKDVAELDWMLPRAFPTHQASLRFVENLNKLYGHESALWAYDYISGGVHFIDANNTNQRVVCLMRRAEGASSLVAALNFSDHAYSDYRIGIPESGVYEEILNSDHADFGGSHMVNVGPIHAEEIPCHGQPCSIVINVPPLTGTYITRRSENACPRKNA